MKILISVAFASLLFLSSCKSRSEDISKEQQTGKQQPMLFDLEVDELSLVNLSKDTNMLSIQSALPSGDVSMFLAPDIPRVDFKILSQRASANAKYVKRSDNLLINNQYDYKI